MTPRNTTDEIKADPTGFVLQALSTSPTDAILMQESQGQHEVVNSTQIPTEMLYCEAEDFETLGFQLGKPGAADPMWREAILPEGWKREGSEHAMWSYIVDAEGYRRVAIFYKAAFYDRRAHVSIERLPRTAAQTDAWENASPGRDELWHSFTDRREGDNYVYAWRGRYGDNAPEGKNAYSDDGRRREVVIAPDGCEIERREFEVEPTDD